MRRPRPKTHTSQIPQTQALPSAARRARLISQCLLTVKKKRTRSNWASRCTVVTTAATSELDARSEKETLSLGESLVMMVKEVLASVWYEVIAFFLLFYQGEKMQWEMAILLKHEWYPCFLKSSFFFRRRGHLRFLEGPCCTKANDAKRLELLLALLRHHWEETEERWNRVDILGQL